MDEHSYQSSICHHELKNWKTESQLKFNDKRSLNQVQQVKYCSTTSYEHQSTSKGKWSAVCMQWRGLLESHVPLEPYQHCIHGLHLVSLEAGRFPWNVSKSTQEYEVVITTLETEKAWSMLWSSTNLHMLYDQGCRECSANRIVLFKLLKSVKE